MTPADTPVSGIAAGAPTAHAGRAVDAAALDGVDLADHAYALWQLGDWSALAEIAEAPMRQHAQRIKLALLVAAAHQQLGHRGAARRFATLAREWGCSDARLARWLLAGVHNTLGRAATALGHMPRAVEHFRLSLSLAAPASVARLALPGRLDAQLAQLGLPAPDEVDARGGRVVRTAQPGALAQAVGSLVDAAEQLQRRHEALLALEGSLREEFASWRQALEATVKREVANMTRQVEAHADVRAYLGGQAMLPALHGWAISADFARQLLELFAAGTYDLVVEFGSGTSTVLLALALQRAMQSGRSPVARLLSFEHQDDYHRQTSRQLQAAGVADLCDLVLAPLRPYDSAQDRIFPFYDCRPALSAYGREWADRHARLLVVVDGPPAATGPQARYPALPILLEHFPSAGFDVLLDDFKRRDEQQVVKMWLADFAAHGFRAVATELDLEKKACLLRADKPAPRHGP